ncbi:unnamed protein product [Eruca vesicaria subsp. sativa]|uniref:Uncharacterized protein n=1 Tax=Eruca vesicaria subsp. sativa TaxID=29727 RepID=A0ABC8LU76_ERUVS|nr:unnamed protein product [Eruca vesicaria subsp. sativa]
MNLTGITPASLNKKRGRRQGSNKQVSPEILKRLGEALLLLADNKGSEAFPILLDIIKEAPTFDQAYYYLALVLDNLGKTDSFSTEALKSAAYLKKGPNSHVWKLLYDRAKEQGNMVLARYYASKAVKADPEDMDLRYEYVELCLSAGEYKEAAKTYEKIFRRHPEIIEPLKSGTKYFLKSGEGERAANMLEDHIKSHPSEVRPDILDLLADVLMQINAYDRALKYIHDVRHQIYKLGKELPSSLIIRQAICHVRLQEMEQAENVLRILPQEAVSEHPKLIIDLADELTNIENFHSALKYYLLAINDTLNNGYLIVKIARCYMSLGKREQAIVSYYRALNEVSDPIDARITLASLLLEDGKRDEAISVLSPPENPDLDTSIHKAWWKKRKIRMHLCQMYHSEGMLEEFANTAFELVLKWVGRRMEEAIKDEEYHRLFVDVCKALTSLQRYGKALEIVNLASILDAKMLPVEKKKELQSLGAKISCDTLDPKQWLDCVRHVIKQHPKCLNAWNCYYKVISRLEKIASRDAAKLMHHLRSKSRDCVPPILIAGHHFTVTSRHQDAAREYLEAYKLMPDSPLINICVGAALINLALGFRLKNRHECLAQGFAFLYKNIRICSNSQEALYNVARGYHHVGLVTLAASYYDKVLAMYEKEYPMPMPKLPNEDPDGAEERKKTVNCDLRKEAAHNLHLIYKHSERLISQGRS